MQSARLTDVDSVHAFVTGGNASFTLVSVKTGSRFTFRVSAPKKTLAGDASTPEEASLWFVSVLTGSDNESSFSYFGNLKRRIGGVWFEHGRKSRLTAFAPSVQAFNWFWAQIAQGKLPACVEFWHEGKCCRCGRKLTVPASIASGVGPECATKGGF